MAEPNCHYCDRRAEGECPTCGRFYCGEHGDDVCLRCMAPESAAPAAAVYRGSVVALVLASLVAVFLLVRPPETKSTNDVARPLAAATSATGATATPTRPGQATATRGAVQATATAGPSGTASPAASQTADASPTAGPRTHTVKAGETLGAIAIANGTTVEAILALNPGITPETLPIGEVLKLP
ncbi:MAG: hypothetical protein C0506_15025 [Anaerolinea sp.]|nr:hypothetical protein [Anaerolinea sp.]